MSSFMDIVIIANDTDLNDYELIIITSTRSYIKILKLLARSRPPLYTTEILYLRSYPTDKYILLLIR